MKKMSLPIDIEAEIYFLTREEGGRHTPAFSGYRPQFYYNNNDWVVSISFPDRAEVMPGQTVDSHIAFMSPQEHLGAVVAGLEFTLREGNRTIATGSVSKVRDLESSAKRYTGKN